MTRNLFGADDAQDLSFAVGWSSTTTDDGWRAPGRIRPRTGKPGQLRHHHHHHQSADGPPGRSPLAHGEPDEGRTCWIHLGVDLLLESDHVGTESSTSDFQSTNTTTTVESGFSAFSASSAASLTGSTW